MKESLRYLHNAKEILKKVPIEGSLYTDVKPVREAFGTAYLAVLEAIKEALIRKGLSKKELPRSTDAYREALRRYALAHDGKLMREFESLYDMLHLGGYYRGLIPNVDVVKGSPLKAAKGFIDKLDRL